MVSVFLFKEVNDFGISSCFVGLWYDLIFTIRIVLFATFFQWIYLVITKKDRFFFLFFFSFIALLFEIALLIYFRETNTLLDEIIYKFSEEDLNIIIKGSGTIGFKEVFVVILLLIGYYLAYRLFIAKIQIRHFWQNLFTFLFLILMFFSWTSKNDDEKWNNFTNNKAAYFIQSSFDYYLTKDLSNEESQAYYQSINPNDFKKIDQRFFPTKPISNEYPLFHELPEESVLSPYFNKTSDGKAPNIVFIICESLGNDFIGDSAKYSGRLMPFLDSLKDESLYWSNFLSLCDRTYNVLPASLASLPTLTKGLLYQNFSNFPLHLSLMTQLKENYYSRFYCGAWLGFTHMDRFMDWNHTDYLVKNWEQELKNELEVGEDSWGYKEKELFKKSWLDYQNQQLNQKKRLDVFLTVSTHHPFKVKNKELYIKKSLDLLQKNERKYHENYEQVKSQIDKFSLYHYLDLQLKKYFEDAKKHPDFKNTIFIIYGDHGSEILLKDDLSRFRIPLFIYSPLLKEAKHFKGVSSQLDISPTLINYLRLNYLPQLSSKSTYLGKELSNSIEYKNDRFLFMGLNLDPEELIFTPQYFLNHNTLYKLGENLKTTKINHQNTKDQLLFQRAEIRKLIDYCMYRNKYAPMYFIQSYFKSNQKIEKEVLKKGNLMTKNIEYIDIGDNFNFKHKSDKLIIEFDTEFYANGKVKYDDIPRLCVSIHNQKDSSLFWNQSVYNDDPNAELKPNSWNKLKTKMTIFCDELNLQKGDELILKYYLLNSTKKMFLFRNSRTKIYF